MNKIQRIKMLKAMEYISRCIKDEEVFERWRIVGTADGDIKPDDLCVIDEDFDNLEYYIDDDGLFASLMDEFLVVMKLAQKDGGLYCDGVCSEDRDYY